MIKVINPGSFSVKSNDFGEGELSAIALRVVCGGKFNQPTFVNNDLLNEITKFVSLAPLHNPAVLQISEMWARNNPQIKQIAVLITIF